MNSLKLLCQQGARIIFYSVGITVQVIKFHRQISKNTVGYW